MATKIYDSYSTDGSVNPISLNVKIGYAQLGSTSVSIDYDQLVIAPLADQNGNYRGDFTIILGTNENLKGKNLSIVTNVSILKSPTASSVSITLSGGVGSHAYSLKSGATAAVGDIINYLASITLI